MTQLAIRPVTTLRGSVRVPGDKSISHRVLMLGSLADGDSQIDGFLPSGDCTTTLDCLRALGVEVEQLDASALTIRGRGLRGLRAPSAPLNCVRSGTTMRLLSGILAGQSFDCTLTGEPQLLRRPMRRVTEPLRRMGADIRDADGRAPLAIRGRTLHGYDHVLSVASAQVKSALLLAGLCAEGPTTVRQCGPARDHTERMLAAMGVGVEVSGLDVVVTPPSVLSPLSMHVPGDFSSAAFLLAAAALVPGSRVAIEGVGVNPTRTGLLDVMREMGAEIGVQNERKSGGEPVADLVVETAPLHGTTVGGDTVVRMIDEFPILAVLATQAEGETVVHDAKELRVKETDRITTLVAELRKLGAHIEPYPDGFAVCGPTPLCGAVVDSRGDHRLAMALAIAGFVAEGETTVQRADCIADSFPGFADLLRELA